MYREVVSAGEHSYKDVITIRTSVTENRGGLYTENFHCIIIFAANRIHQLFICTISQVVTIMLIPEYSRRFVVGTVLRLDLIVYQGSCFESHKPQETRCDWPGR